MVLREPRVALYLRRSTEEHQEASLEVQEEQARRFLSKFGPHSLAPEHVFVDSGVSRAEFTKRPGLLSLLQAIEKRTVDMVVTRDESRLGGDMLRVSLLLQDMLDAGMKVFYYYTGEQVQLDTAVARFMVTARNFSAEVEREKISQRTHEALLVKARRGLNVGGRCYGYNNVEVKDGERRKHVTYEVNPDHRDVIVGIFARYANGDGLRTIASDLNARGVPSPSAGKRGTGSWSPSMIFEVLRRRRYVGVIVWNQREKMYRKGTKIRVQRPAHEWLEIEAPHLRLVTDDLWNAAHAQMRLKKNGSDTKTTEAKKGGRPAGYLLSGITKCGICGGSLTVVSSRHGSSLVKVYLCSYRRDRGEAVCKNRLRRPLEGVDHGVVNWIESNILSEELVLDTLKVVRRRLNERMKQTNQDVPKLEAEAHKLRAQIANLVDILSNTPKASAEGIVAGINERQEQLNGLEARLRAFMAAPGAVDLEVRRMEVEAKARLGDLRTTLQRHPKEARAIISAIFGGSLTAVPILTPDGPRLQIEGTASVGRMLALEMKLPAGGSAKTPPASLRPQGDSNPC